MSSAVCNLFREYLNSQGFIEIHTPKLQGAATESGASVFKVQYFNGKLTCSIKRTISLRQAPPSLRNRLNSLSRCVSLVIWSECTRSPRSSVPRTRIRTDT